MQPTWNGSGWFATVDLPAWRALLEKRTTKAVGVKFLLDDAGAAAGPSPTNLNTLAHLASQQELCDVVLAAIRRHYDRVRPKYLALARKRPDFMGDPAVSMPADPDPQTFARLHTLQGVYVHPVEASGLSYVGLAFAATWEPEHGLGVMIHDQRVVDVGGAETAFTTWIAESDREKS
jgi:hypothetical protein